MRSIHDFLLQAVFVALVAGIGLTAVNRAPSAFASGGEQHPVVIELFTSEGCSSCPAADAFLKRLDDAGRVNDVDIIAIEEHVDYWDRLGWRDPFSSHQWTERQESYSRSLGHEGIYTPQLIVDGKGELRAGSSRDVQQEIVDASRAAEAKLQLSVTESSERSAVFSMTMENFPPEARKPQLLLAVTERGLSSNVLGGENEGRNLAHAAVLRSLSRVKFSPANSGTATQAKTTISLDLSWKRENLRFVAILQDSKTLHILGAAAASLPR
jgi:hypothetical protein